MGGKGPLWAVGKTKGCLLLSQSKDQPDSTTRGEGDCLQRNLLRKKPWQIEGRGFRNGTRISGGLLVGKTRGEKNRDLIERDRGRPVGKRTGE